MSRNFNSNIDWFNQPNSLTYNFDNYKWYEDEDREEDKVPTNTMNNYGNSITSLLTPTLSGGVSTNNVANNNSSNNSGRLNDWMNFGGNVVDLVGSFKGGVTKTGSGGGMPWGAIGSVVKSGYNAITGHNDKDYSDLEESIIYPLQGAATGSKFGPWGAAGGALYGLGYSFKDDLGMKDSNFLTQLLFPIGMGDGGGLKIGGKSILDLG